MADGASPGGDPLPAAADDGATPPAAAAAAATSGGGPGLRLTFAVHYESAYGERVWVAGSPPGLGAWAWRTAALKLRWSPGHVWRGALTVDPSGLPVDEHGRRRLEYKYLVAPDGGDRGAKAVFEEGGNRVLLVPPGVGDAPPRDGEAPPAAHVHDTWGDVGAAVPVVAGGGGGGGGLPGGVGWWEGGGGGGGVRGGVGTDQGPPGTHPPASDWTVAPGEEGVDGVVEFFIHYETDFGSNVCVAGGLRELGVWDSAAAPALSTVPGCPSAWRLRLPLQRPPPSAGGDAAASSAAAAAGGGRAPNGEELDGETPPPPTALEVAAASHGLAFEYKYFLRRPDGSRVWEGGPNRLAALWPNADTTGAGTAAMGVPAATPLSGGGKVATAASTPNGVPTAMAAAASPTPTTASTPTEVLVLNDRWERVRFEFSIFFPTGQDETMHITGDPLEIGGWFRPGPTRLSLGRRQRLETDVDGQKWELAVYVPVDTPPFSYRYIIINDSTGQALWEREPNRRGEFDPHAAAVNSVRRFVDVNFVGGMAFDFVPDDLFIGPYPQTADDVKALAAAGATAVFNVQTDEDFAHRGVQWRELLAAYADAGVAVVRYPIADFDRASLRARLHGAACEIDALVSAGHKVYIHCTAGMGRAPASAVAYLCMVRGWDLDEAVAHVKKHRPVAVPNVPVLRDALNEPFVPRVPPSA